jgi:hypothetical protein
MGNITGHARLHGKEHLDHCEDVPLICAQSEGLKLAGVAQLCHLEREAAWPPFSAACAIWNVHISFMPAIRGTWEIS